MSIIHDNLAPCLQVHDLSLKLKVILLQGFIFRFNTHFNDRTEIKAILVAESHC